MKLAWGWLVLVACGTDARTVDVAIPGTQVLVTEKVDGGPWKKLSGQFDGGTNQTAYAIEIGEEYELVVVCIRSGPTDAGQFDSAQLFGTSEDAEVTLGTWPTPDCRHDGNWQTESSGDPVTITGTFDETMDLSLGTEKVHLTQGHVFAFGTRTGRHDLIAYSNTKVLIQRDLQITGDMGLDPVHVARDGTTMLSTTSDLTGDAEEGEPYVYSYLSTRNDAGFMWLDPSSRSTLFVPPSLLVPGDVQVLWVTFAAGMTSRDVRIVDPTRLADATLLPRITSATANPQVLGMTWSPIDDLYTYATVESHPAKRSWQSVTASRSWLERHGRNTLSFDPAIDDYDPSWTITSSAQLSLVRWNPTMTTSTRAVAPEAP